MKLTIATLLASLTIVPHLQAQKGPQMHTKFGIGTSSMYFFRGIMQQNGGLIFQPELEISRDGMEVYEHPFAWNFGTWNSLHEGQTGTSAAGTNSAWYESQFYAGFTVGVIEKLDVSMSYAALSSPNGGGFRIDNARGRPTQELRFRGTWDDGVAKPESGLKGLFPYSELVFELAGGRDAGSSLGTYLEIGIEPRLDATEDIEITIPVRLGLSLGNYYENAGGSDEFFGFLSVGAHASMPFGSKDGLFGLWQFRAFLEVIVLGDHAEQFNNGDGMDLVLGASMQLTW